MNDKHTAFRLVVPRCIGAIVVTLVALSGTGCAHAGTRIGYSREPIQATWSECRALALNSSQRLACDQAAWLECRAAAHPLTCAE